MLIPSELCVPAGMLGLTAPWFGMCTESGDVWFLLHEPQTIIHTTKFCATNGLLNTHTTSS